MRIYARRYDYAEIHRLLRTTDEPCWRIAQRIGCSTSLVQRIDQGRTGREAITQTNTEREHAR